MRRWLYNLLMPPPNPKFAMGEMVTSRHLFAPSRIINRKLECVRPGVQWNEESRGWTYLLIEPIGFWLSEEILEVLP